MAEPIGRTRNLRSNEPARPGWIGTRSQRNNVVLHKDSVSILDNQGELIGGLVIRGKPTSVAFSPAPFPRTCVTTVDACYLFDVSRSN